MRITRQVFFSFLLLVLFSCGSAYASHIVGADFTYKFLDSSAAGKNYEVTMVLFHDCLNANPGAIASDNPAKIDVYDAASFQVVRSDNISYISSVAIPANFSNECVTNPPDVCLLKTTFVAHYLLPPNAAGYIIAFQRCCRNLNIVNISAPGGVGSTYFCTIPPYIVPSNSSAIFRSYPPQIICANNPLSYDHSATDSDGDSLTYEFCNALRYDGDNTYNTQPPYDTVQWLRPVYSFSQPITGTPAITIDHNTGMITGTPDRVGRYLVTVCCNEWRNGVLINTSKREFQFVVTNCERSVIADIPQFSPEPNTYILNCADYNVHFINKSKGGYAYHWDFGVKETSNDTSVDFEPTFTYPDTGIYVVRLIVNKGGTCQDSISKLVKIYPTFHVAFDDTGYYCPGAAIQFRDISVATIKPVLYWQWSFGDSSMSSDQHPLHTYVDGGTYNVVLVSGNIKGCRDTALRRVVIDNFYPFAGNDTAIVKGESIIFNAQGGVQYSWSPADGLGSTDIANPRGYYPEVGRYSYTVQVESIYGCRGQAQINVDVVDQASFCVPNAFTPNGDGLNDIFRAKSVGFSAIKYLKVYNRFGELVYVTDRIEDGWDGTYNHKQADIGVYFWHIVYIDRYGKDAFMKGDVTLLR